MHFKLMLRKLRWCVVCINVDVQLNVDVQPELHVNFSALYVPKAGLPTGQSRNQSPGPQTVHGPGGPRLCVDRLLICSVMFTIKSDFLKKKKKLFT